MELAKRRLIIYKLCWRGEEKAPVALLNTEPCGFMALYYMYVLWEPIFYSWVVFWDTLGLVKVIAFSISPLKKY